ncbi:hypothetical protein Tco_1362536 [Tanacetum coccineum]
MLAPKGSTYNGRSTFANPMYLKKAQSEKPCLYEIPYDTSNLANRFAPNREETLTLEQVCPYGTRGTNDDVAASFQQSRIHYHMLMLKPQRHTISIKIQELRKLKYKEKDFRKLSYSRSSFKISRLSRQRLSREIVSKLLR